MSKSFVGRGQETCLIRSRRSLSGGCFNTRGPTGTERRCMCCRTEIRNGNADFQTEGNQEKQEKTTAHAMRQHFTFQGRREARWRSNEVITCEITRAPSIRAVLSCGKLRHHLPTPPPSVHSADPSIRGTPLCPDTPPSRVPCSCLLPSVPWGPARLLSLGPVDMTNFVFSSASPVSPLVAALDWASHLKYVCSTHGLWLVFLFS